MLLLRVLNPTSFDDLKTYNGVQYSTFQESCVVRGFLDDDKQWDATLKECILYYSPKTVQMTFAYILAYVIPSEPHRLWEKHKASMCEDLFMRVRSCISDSIQITTAS
jgi:hypothetical protein